MGTPKPILYLMLGYPGSGKTTAAKLIHEQTGAVHLWADKIRRERFGTPNYSHTENIKLYEHLNQLTAELLAAGQSVIFDTNFNFYRDREHLRHIATLHGATSLLLWVQTPEEIAKARATELDHTHHTRVLGQMSLEHFKRISSNLEPPRANETHITIDGTKITPSYIKQSLRSAQAL